MAKQKIGILGSGIVARTLGDGFLKHGHEVMLGTRDQAKLADWQRESSGRGQVGSFADAARFGDVVVLATKGAATEAAMRQADLKNLAAKVVMDTTNPIDDSRPPRDGVLTFYTNQGESQLERLQAIAPAARLVKAFNSVGSAFMVDPPFAEKPTMFICGNDEAARAEVAGLVAAFGWEAEDMGSAAAAGAIESLCILWCIPGLRQNRWTHAFRLLKM
jgi:8-hydroxy-5-deazaflavin:NADPH oxidoreductase